MDPRSAFQQLKRRVEMLRIGQALVSVLGLLLEAGAIILGAVAIAIVVEALLRPAPDIRAALLFLVGAAGLGLLALRVARVWRSFPSRLGVAHLFEKSQPGLDEGAVRSALSLWGKRDAERHGYSADLIDAHLNETAGRSGARARGVVRKRALVRAGASFVGVLVLLALGWLAAPDTATEALARIRQGATELTPDVSVTPGDVTLVQGSELVISAAVDPPPARAPIVHLSERGGESSHTMPRVLGEDAHFQKVFGAVNSDLEYRVSVGDWESPTYRVTVSRAPLLLSVEKRYRFPEYTGLGERVVEETDGHIKALRGTEVALTFKSGGPISRGTMRLNTGALMPLELVDPTPREGSRLARTTLTIGNPDRYQVSLWDRVGNPGEQSPIFDVEPIADEAPIVTLLSPASDTTLSREMFMDVHASVLDDFGVTKVSLVYSKGSGETRVPIHRGGGTDQIDYFHEWDLSAIEMLPGEVLSMYVEAWDNDAVLGSKRGVSRTISLRFPTLAEIFEEVREEEAGQTESLTEAFETSMNLKEQIQSMVRDMRREKETAGSWQKQEEVERILEKQEQIAEELGNVAEELDQTMQKLERNNLITPDVLQKLSEIRKLVEEVATDEMKAAMDKLRQAMEKLDPQQIAEASKKLANSQEEFLQRLDRTIEMLKAVQRERRLEEMVREMEELAEREESLMEATEQSSQEQMEAMASEQDGIKKETEQAIDKMEQMAEELAKDEPEAGEAVDQAADALQEEGATEQMQQASQSLSTGRKSPAMQSGKKAGKSLSKAAQSLQTALQMMSTRQDEVVREAIEKGVRNLVYLSKAEESLVERSEEAASRPRGSASALARRQVELKRGIEVVATDLEEAMKKSMHIGPTVPEILRRAQGRAEESAAALSQGNSRVGALLGNQTMVTVNEGLVKLLQTKKDFESACQNSQASGQCNNPSLNQMSQSQCNLNEGASGMSKKMGQRAGERLSQSDQSRLSQMAAQQQAIRQGLEEFAEAQGEQQGVLGRLDNIIDEMKEAEGELRSAKPGEMARRGERILQRLLDADRSIRRQGFKRERTSQSAKTGLNAPSPAALSEVLQQADPSVREDILRTLSVRFPGEYEALIRAYFEALEKDAIGGR